MSQTLDTAATDELQRAGVWFDRGQFEDARDACISLLRRKPADGGALRLLARAYLATGAFGDALSVLAKIRDIRPDEGWLFVAFGHVTLVKGSPATAAEHFRRAMAMGEDGPDVHAFLAAALRRMGQEDEAVAVITDALEWAPDSARLHRVLGDCLSNTDQGAAIDAYRTVIDLADATDVPRVDLGHAHVQLGMLLGLEGQYEMAHQHLCEGKALMRAPPEWA